MDGARIYHWATNAAMVGVIAVIGVGALGMTGCTLEGDTYSGTVVNVDCGTATSGGGLQNCGSGSPHDDHHSEEIAAE